MYFEGVAIDVNLWNPGDVRSEFVIHVSLAAIADSGAPSLCRFGGILVRFDSTPSVADTLRRIAEALRSRISSEATAAGRNNTSPPQRPSGAGSKRASK